MTDRLTGETLEISIPKVAVLNLTTEKLVELFDLEHKLQGLLGIRVRFTLEEK